MDIPAQKYKISVRYFVKGKNVDILTSMHADTYVRSLQFLAKSKGDRAEAWGFAKAALGPTNGTTKLLEKSFISGGDIADDPDLSAARRGFLELVRARSILGKIQGWRRTEFNAPMLRETVTPVSSWVGQGKARPVTAASFQAETLERRKIGCITVVTSAVATGAGNNFTSALSRDLSGSIAATEAASLLDPAIAGDSDTPASLTYGATEIISSGINADAVRTDFQALFGAFGGDLDSAYIAMNSQTALSLSFLQAPLGEINLTVNGGDIFGIRVVTSSAVPIDSNGSIVALIDPGRILLADAGVDIDLSREASVQVSGGDGADGVFLDLWQNNLIGFSATRFLNWKPAPGSVVYLSGVAYGASA